MRRRERYRVARSVKQFLAVTRLSPERVLQRAELPCDYLENEGGGLDAAGYFRLAEAVAAEANRPDFIRFAATTSANGPLVAPVYAFVCSPTIRQGLERLRVFKPLVGPITLTATREEDAVRLAFGSADPYTPITPVTGAYELVYFVELCRKYTAAHVVPLEVRMPQTVDDHDGLDDYMGVACNLSEQPSLVLSAADADRPLISENAEMWGVFETELRKQMLKRERNAAMSTRVKSVLLEMLPAGSSSADDVCKTLMVSRRSLQRRLQEEGLSYREVLDDTRSELSMHYLSKGDMSIEEISYLLAYQDPNSFYRAFHGWTGMTPMEVRGMRKQ